MNSHSTSLALLLLVSAASMQARSAVPVQLTAALQKHGCSEIINQSEFQNLSGHWWVSLKEFTGLDTDFAFFCHDKTDRMKTRLIVDATGEANPWKGCRQTIVTWQGRVKPQLPIDLEVITTASRYGHISDLRKWVLVDSSKNANVTFGPVGSKVPSLVIDTTGQSAGDLYACFQGKWYTIGLDFD